jgi:hypothetical protein
MVEDILARYSTERDLHASPTAKEQWLGGLRERLLELSASKQGDSDKIQHQTTMDMQKQADLLTLYVYPLYLLGFRYLSLFALLQGQRIALAKGLQLVGLVLPSDPTALLSEPFMAFSSSSNLWTTFSELVLEDERFKTAFQLALVCVDSLALSAPLEFKKMASFLALIKPLSLLVNGN